MYLSRLENIGSCIRFYKSARDNCKSFVSRTFLIRVIIQLETIYFLFFFFLNRDNVKEAPMCISTWGRRKEKIFS